MSAVLIELRSVRPHHTEVKVDGKHVYDCVSHSFTEAEHLKKLLEAMDVAWNVRFEVVE